MYEKVPAEITVLNAAMRARSSLGVYEAINKHVDIINNSDYKSFFALIQKNAIEVIIVSLSSLYEKDIKKKYTINYLKSQLVENKDLFIGIDIKKQYLQKLLPLDYLGDATATDQTVISDVYDAIIGFMPKEMPKAKKLVAIARNNIIAHNAILDSVKRDNSMAIPSIHEMDLLSEYAIALSQLCFNARQNPIGIVGPCSRMATLNAIRKLCNVSFSQDIHSLNELEKFYAREL